MPDLKLYTIADLRAWLINGMQIEGLNEHVISPVRACAIVHNPYVKDADNVVAAIYENGELAAYAASFPDKIEGQRIWWCSTLFCHPHFSGRGYGLIVIGSLKESHEPEMTYDRWGAPETVMICERLGLKTTYTKRYTLAWRTIRKNTLRSHVAYYRQEIQRLFRQPACVSAGEYSLRYLNYIDGESYAFMQSQRKKDLWFREQTMFNWILHYPFMQGCTLLKKVEHDCEFSANVSNYELQVVKVYHKGVLIGIYILRRNAHSLSVVYLYYDAEKSDLVFASIVDHVASIRPMSFVTDDVNLFSYVREKIYFPKRQEDSISLSVPNDVVLPSMFTLQMGDGDSFA